MKNKLLILAALGSLLLSLGLAQAASPRFDNWGEWQQKDIDPETELAQSAAEDKPKQDKASQKDDEQGDKPAEKRTEAKQTPSPKKPKAKAMAQPGDSATLLGPPTKGRRATVSNEDDRLQPTPAPRVIVTQDKRANPNGAQPEEKLSWWERWKRKRQGIPLKPVVIPESRIYTVRLRDGRWTATSTRLECKLYQTIPRLGKVMFQQKVGVPLHFTLELDRSYEEIHQASFETTPPNWGHQTHKQPMSLSASLHKASISIPREGAIRLINELLEGMAPRMTYRMGDQEDSDEVVVTLSARTFADKLQIFQACIDNLLPYKFETVKESIVYFNFDSATLTNKAEKALARVAEYVQLDDKVKRIVIEGHTDSKGFRRYNYRLATQRAKAVEKFFLNHGVSKSRLVLRSRAFGEKKPVATNKSAKGRAQNRRVHISLFK
jgi:outer membrane protein OmpA-like peptidoglycan-associated protein